MNTYVVLTGLMLIVPMTGQSVNSWGGLTVLVLEADGARDRYGEEIHAHDKANIANLAAADDHVPLRGRWTFQTEGATNIMARTERLLRLEDLYEEEGSTLAVRSACLRDDADSCSTGWGRKLVKGKVTFEGAWKLRAIDIDYKTNPRADVQDDSIFGFLRMPRGRMPRALKHTALLAGGVVLEGSGDVKINGAAEHALLKDKSTAAACQRAVGVAKECRMIRVMNLTSHPAGPDPDGGWIGADVHADLVYDLLKPAPDRRYMPFLRSSGPKAKCLFPDEQKKVDADECTNVDDRDIILEPVTYQNRPCMAGVFVPAQ